MPWKTTGGDPSIPAHHTNGEPPYNGAIDAANKVRSERPLLSNKGNFSELGHAQCDSLNSCLFFQIHSYVLVKVAQRLQKYGAWVKLQISEPIYIRKLAAPVDQQGI